MKCFQVYHNNTSRRSFNGSFLKMYTFVNENWTAPANAEQSLHPYPYPSHVECEQSWQEQKLEQERRQQAQIAKQKWQQEHPYENMLEQMQKQMLTTKEGLWKLTAFASHTAEMDALFQHANQLHPQYLIGIKWFDRGVYGRAYVTLEVSSNLELKRTRPRSDISPSHNHLIIQKQDSDEIMIAEFDAETSTWKIGAPEPSPFLSRIRTNNGSFPVGKKISEMNDQQLLDVMVGPGSFKTFAENGIVSDVVKCLKTSWEPTRDP